MVIVGIAKTNRCNITKIGTRQILFRHIRSENGSQTVVTPPVKAKETITQLDIIVSSLINTSILNSSIQVNWTGGIIVCVSNINM